MFDARATHAIKMHLHVADQTTNYNIASSLEVIRGEMHHPVGLQQDYVAVTKSGWDTSDWHAEKTR